MREEKFLEPVTRGWRFVSIGFEGDPVDLDGVDPWAVDWDSTGGNIVVAHPSYPWQRHTMSTYVAGGPGKAVEFAAGEFSNGVWGFFLREPPRRGDTRTR